MSFLFANIAVIRPPLGLWKITYNLSFNKVLLYIRLPLAETAELESNRLFQPCLLTLKVSLTRCSSLTLLCSKAAETATACAPFENRERALAVGVGELLWYLSSLF